MQKRREKQTKTIQNWAGVVHTTKGGGTPIAVRTRARTSGHPCTRARTRGSRDATHDARRVTRVPLFFVACLASRRLRSDIPHRSCRDRVVQSLRRQAMRSYQGLLDD